MNREEYGNAYEQGFRLTVRFLVSRGLFAEAAEETAQAAWAKGWERLAQLRNENMLLTWVNSIALNLYRGIRRKPLLQPLPELSAPARVNLAAIDADRILMLCKPADRVVLQKRYLEGWGIRDIARNHGWSETAVRIRLVRARRSARAKMDTPCLQFRSTAMVSRHVQTALRQSAAA